MHLWLASFGRAGLILGVSGCFGYPLSRRILRGPAAPALAVLLGLAVFSLLVCLLSWLRLFTGLSIGLIAAVGVLATARCLSIDLPRGRRTWRSWPRPTPAVIASFAVLLIALLGFSVLVLYPSTAFDATSYHLPLARDLVDRHGLVYDPYVRYSFFPQANEAMFAVMLLLTHNPTASAALEFSVLALGTLTVPLWFLGAGRRVGGGLVAGLAVLASPVVIWAGTAAFVDTWTLVFVMAVMLVGLDAVEGRGHPVAMFAIAGAMLGEAAATKYTGAVFGAGALAGVLMAAGRSRAVWKALPAAAGGFAAIALPWYAWTLHSTGNPVYPFATGLFRNRSGLWTAAEIKVQDFVARANVKPGVLAILRRDIQYLRGEVEYLPGPYRSPLSWALGIGFLRLLWPSAWRDRTFIGTAFAAGLCVVASLFISADPRYLVPALGLLALTLGLAADWAIGATSGWLRGRLHKPGLAPVWCALAAILVLFSAAGYGLDFRSTNGNPPTGAAKISAYLARQIPCYAAVSYLNGLAGSRYRVWADGCEQAHYYAHGRLIGDAFSNGSEARILNDQGSAVPDDLTLSRRLAPLDVQWALLPAQIVRDPSALQAHGLFAYVATVGPVDVFRVRRAPAQALATKLTRSYAS